MTLKPSLFGLLASVLASAVVQAAEEYPPLPTWKCTSSGCVQQNTTIVLDKDSKFAKGSAGSRSTADYAAMGVTTSGNALTMYHYVKSNGALNAASPRVYLLGEDGKYVLMSLLNQEISVDVDFSSLPCGENGAFYLSEMDGKANGGSGQGYCDAQCPQRQCCNEMDMQVSPNSMASAFTGHPCKGSTCDSGGCGLNKYASGDRNFWGPGKTVDTSKPFTVITQFPASGGKLSRITRRYIQNGRQTDGGSINSCGNEGSTGGLSGMGAALGRGMVLAMSIWNDPAQQMAWLDSGNNGPCASGQGTPANIQSQHPDTHVIFSNIRWGDIGSTTKN
ncbi:glycoside hydrolase [Thozetella sp. PMI_491]|nr:glycoside hydrolase [Thozetella sp. PMI_491]